ncbi:MAG: hypothetical protein ACFFC3_02675, partial [Candidatus Odinarchaeota archaeon]
MNTSNKWLKVPPSKIISYLIFILNLCCIFLGVLYISFPIYSILWDYFGVILLITIFENLIMISINSIKERN